MIRSSPFPRCYDDFLEPGIELFLLNLGTVALLF